MTDKSGTYRDAILEAKRLREVAEANAKRALIEAVTPRIRDMIERELLGEDVDVSDEDLLEGVASEALGDDEEAVQESAPAGEVPGAVKASDSGSVITDGDGEDCEEEDLLLSREAVNALNAMTESTEIAKLEARASGAVKKLALVKEMMASGAHKKASDRTVVLNMLRKIISETKFLTETVIRKREKGRIPATLVSNVKSLSEEIRMSSKARKLKEEAGKDMYEIDMSGLDADTEDAPEAGGLEDLEAGSAEDMGGEDGEGEVAEIPMDLAQELLAALEADVGGEEAEMPAEDMPAEDEGGEDEGDEEEELDDDEIVEIDEGMLRRELARMKGARTLRESKTSAHDASVLDDFGGGEVEREMFVDSTDEDLNVLETRRLKTALKNESRKNRALRTEVENSKKVIHKLKEQIEAVNLFNAKLLYVNRMMANEGVSPRQRKAFITSLDKAESLREVKLLYKTVTDHVGKRQASPMTESTSRRAASASKVTQAGSLSEAADPTLNRWARLAGIDQSE